jgi:hypothetical protein
VLAYDPEVELHRSYERFTISSILSDAPPEGLFSFNNRLTVKLDNQFSISQNHKLNNVYVNHLANI